MSFFTYRTYEGTIPSKIIINGIGTREAWADESRSATHAAQPEAEAGPEQGGDKEDCWGSLHHHHGDLDEGW